MGAGRPTGASGEVGHSALQNREAPGRRDPSGRGGEAVSTVQRLRSMSAASLSPRRPLES